MSQTPDSVLPSVAAKPRFVRGMFDAIAGRYDVMNRLMTGGQDERWRRITADAALPETISVALDLGAGTGDLAFALARRAPHARVIAADFSPAMLAEAIRKAGATRAGRHVLPLLADGMQIPLANESVDAIVSGFVLRNVQDVSGLFDECRRVLKPGGRVALLDLTPVRRAPFPGFARLFNLYFGTVVPLIGSLVSGRGRAYRYLPSSVKVFPDADAIARRLRDAGLEDVSYRLLGLGTLALHVGRRAPAREEAGEVELTEREVVDANEWNETLAGLPNAHLLQSWQWAELKRDTGWTPTRIVFERDGSPAAAASIGRLKIPRSPWGVAYCQKGPALDYGDLPLFRAVIGRLGEWARRERCIVLTVDPDVEWSQSGCAAALREAGYRPGARQFQAPSTVLVDLRGDDKELLRRMSSTWRRYVNKAQREGVAIRTGAVEDIPTFFSFMQYTEERQGFVIRPLEYYRKAFEKLYSAGIAELFIADVDGVPKAGVFGCRLGKRAWYLYGGAIEAGLKAHASHLLQWHTMQWARDAECETYDMWGAPDDPMDKDDPLAGVYYFKRGFGGRHLRTLGAHDYVTSQPLYLLWQRALPLYLGALRRLSGERVGAAGHD
ncbi:MAG: ubiquinone/menaquinone biosynthesis methyltransferase [Chloroflexota bacterium]